MLLLDVNVVVAAYRADHPHNHEVRPWFDHLTSSGRPFAVPTFVWASFLRLVTNRRVFELPSSVASAFSFIDATSAQPGYLVVVPGPRHLLLLRKLCQEADAQGDLIPDAVLAALALEHGGEIVTRDRDFARFSSVRHLRPEASATA